MPTNKLSMCLIGALMVIALPVQAGVVTFTIEAPLIQTSQIAGVTTQDFDSVALGVFPGGGGFNWAGVGTYTGSGGTVLVADKWGGAGGAGRYMAAISPGVTLTFDNPLGVGYVGFWWSAGDPGNRVDVFMADGTMHEFTTQSIFDSSHLVNSLASAGGHIGNPNPNFLDQGGEAPFHAPYAYVNIYAENNASKITSVKFFGASFENDNHSVLAALVHPDDQSGGVVDRTPEPGTLGLASIIGAGCIVFGIRRRRALAKRRSSPSTELAS